MNLESPLNSMSDKVSEIISNNSLHTRLQNYIEVNYQHPSVHYLGAR